MKFWLKVVNDLKLRGCDDILIAVTDGLRGIADALEAVYPRTTLQTCIVHLLHSSLGYSDYRLSGTRRCLEADLQGSERRSGRGGTRGVCRRGSGCSAS